MVQVVRGEVGSREHLRLSESGEYSVDIGSSVHLVLHVALDLPECIEPFGLRKAPELIPKLLEIVPDSFIHSHSLRFAKICSTEPTSSPQPASIVSSHSAPEGKSR